jgi:hypothetical protein
MNEIEIKPAMRRSDKSKELEAAGVSGAALEALLSETAAERHMDRIRYTADLAEKMVVTAGVPPKSALAAMAGLLVADLCGVGGHMDVEGAATERILAEAGKGRWQARDGQAYRAAAKHIVGVLRPRVEPYQREHVSFTIDLGQFGQENDRNNYTRSGSVVGKNKFLDRTVGFQGFGLYLQGVESMWVADTFQVVPLRWQMTLAREGLRRAAGLEPWFPDVLYSGSDSRLGPENNGTLEIWSEVVNALAKEDAIMEAEQAAKQAASVI